MSETATRLEDIDLFGSDDDLPPNDDLDTENDFCVFIFHFIN